MTTEIRVWQIESGELIPLETTMAEARRTEPQDLQQWIKSKPEILGQDILIIGEKVSINGGEIDFVGVDKAGNVVIIELKRDRLPREVLAQAIDYASAAALWDLDKLNGICERYKGQKLDEYVSENFADVDLEDLSWNESQRILLVGASVEESLQRMMDWLFSNYGVTINAIIFKYIRTRKNEELVARTTTIPEDLAKEKSRKQQRRMATSDEPGDYGEEELRTRLKDYLSETRATPRRIREILLPLCLQRGTVTRDVIKQELVKKKEAVDEGKAGTLLTTISRELSIERRRDLRQVISYDKPLPWEKDNYRIKDAYKEMVKQILKELESSGE